MCSPSTAGSWEEALEVVGRTCFRRSPTPLAAELRPNPDPCLSEPARSGDSPWCHIRETGLLRESR